MPITYKWYLGAVFAAFALPAMAQDAGTVPAAEPPAAEAEAPTASDEPAVGETRIIETFSDWSLRCIRAENGDDQCQLYQALTASDGSPVATVEMVPIPKSDKPVVGKIAVTAPLGTLLPAGVKISVDAGKEGGMPFIACHSRGCVSEVGAPQELIDAFKKGSSATVTIRAAQDPNRPFELTLSLSGFTKAWDEISQLEPAAAN